ncbi:MAG: hypothetical protein AB7I04_13535 [Pseudomonadales bacterium]
MKTAVLTVFAVLVIWSMFRRAEVDETDPYAPERADRGKAVPVPSFARRKQSA